MVDAASVFTSFPAKGGYSTNELYDEAAIQHLKKLETTLFSDGGVTGDKLAQIIKVDAVPPQSLLRSYVY